MRKIIAGTFITLDGVMEAPGSGDTTLPTKRGWTEPFMDADIGQALGGLISQNDAMLLGRTTYEGFAAFWPNADPSDPFTKHMNEQRKYVVSTTMEKADWNNTTIINGSIPEEIAKLKQQPGGTIGITGSGTLIRSLIQYDLIDELHLLVFPIVLGVGKKLFTEGETTTLQLIDAKPFKTGVVILSYQPAKKA